MIIIASLVSFFILVRFIIILINYISNPSLSKIKGLNNDLVSILVPARNEANNIKRLLDSIETQDYLNYELIVLDDGSTDQTFEICSNLAGNNQRVKVIRGKPLPENWLGKNYACHQLAKKASGSYLLFLDADVCLYDGTINSALTQLKAKKLQLLSLFAKQETITLGEKTVVPLMHYLLLSLLPIRLIYRGSDPSFGVASGQFMLFEASSYRSYQWHKMVRGQVVEDVTITRMIKRAGLRVESLLANGLVSCRMYKNYNEAIEGFSKNFLSIFNNSIPLFAGYLSIVILGPLFILITFNILFVLILLIIIVMGRIMIAHLSEQNAFFEVILHPFQLINLFSIFIMIIYLRLTGNSQWKGRLIRS